MSFSTATPVSRKNGDARPERLGMSIFRPPATYLIPLRKFLVGILCIVLMLASNAICAAPQQAENRARTIKPRVLTSAREAHQLNASEASQKIPVRLRAVVTYYDPAPDPRHSVFFVADATGAIYVALQSTPATALKAGDLVEISGISGPGEFAPVVAQAEAKQISRSRLPATATRASMADMLTGRYDGQWVEIEGVVHAVRLASKYLYLDIAMRDGNITAMTPNADYHDLSSLIDRTILLRGNEGTVFNDQGQMTGAHLLFPGMETVTFEQAASTDPFSLPVEHISNLLHYTAANGFNHRVHVQGIVSLQWPGRLLCIEDQGHRLCAEIEQTTPVQRGDRIDVVGFAQIGDFTPTLTHATYRAAAGREPLQPESLTADQALLGGHDSELITIDAQLIGHDLSATDPTIVLHAGKSVFNAILPRKYLAQDLLLEEGSLLRITGICSAKADGSKWDSRSGFPIATSFRILRASPADTLVLKRPSWWNATHTLRVLAFALAIALLALIRVLMLGARVKRQTSTILESEERFRHMASHDGLTQLPNRASVLNALEDAIQRAREKKTSVCVALLDLDHFKDINDRLGHLAGDEVLRISAQRLSAAIRSTDIIGRYGGEEFLIVFHDMEQEHGKARCELVRQALCEKPIHWQGHDLVITCSIGVAAARTTQAPIPALVSIADHAMYAAKSQGRNRVVSAPETVSDVA